MFTALITLLVGVGQLLRDEAASDWDDARRANDYLASDIVGHELAVAMHYACEGVVGNSYVVSGHTGVELVRPFSLDPNGCRHGDERYECSIRQELHERIEAHYETQPEPDYESELAAENAWLRYAESR